MEGEGVSDDGCPWWGWAGRPPLSPAAIVRPAVSERLLMRAAHRLTDRDRMLLALLWEHRTLTTEQLAAVAFDSMTTARHRLTVLHGLRLVDRFQPRRADAASTPYHYLLDHLGSLVVAADRGYADPLALDWRKDNALAITRSQRLAHLVGTNGLFTALAGRARRDPDATLRLWWSEGRFAAWMAAQTARWPDAEPASDGRSWRRVPRPRPDGYGVWTERDATVAFCVEYDRGTETLARLDDKMPGYVELAWLFGTPPWTLFAFPSPRRERSARRVLAAAPVPVATASAVTDPAGPVWAPVDNDDADRLRLAALALRTDLPPPVRPLLAALAAPGSRAARRRTGRDEQDGGLPPSPTDPDGRDGAREAFI